MSQKPKTAAERNAALAERKKKQGLVKISVSDWVPAAKAERCKELAKRAIRRELSCEL